MSTVQHPQHIAKLFPGAKTLDAAFNSAHSTASEMPHSKLTHLSTLQSSCSVALCYPREASSLHKTLLQNLSLKPAQERLRLTPYSTFVFLKKANCSQKIKGHQFRNCYGLLITLLPFPRLYSI